MFGQISENDCRGSVREIGICLKIYNEPIVIMKIKQTAFLSQHAQNNFFLNSTKCSTSAITRKKQS